MVRIQCETELNQEGSCDIKNLIQITEKAKEQFTNIKYKFGEERAQFYIDFLKKRESGETGEFKKFVKFKTLKRDHIQQEISKNTVLESSVLKDEDIKLFVEVIEGDQDFKANRLRFSQQNSPARYGSRENIQLSKSSIDSIISNKIKNHKKRIKKIRMLQPKKVSGTRISVEHMLASSKSKKSKPIILDSLPSIHTQDSIKTKL